MSIRRVVKRLLRSVGIDVHGYTPGSSRDAQLQAALMKFNIGVVVDIGANEGQFGSELLAAGYRGKIISIEPLVEAHSKLVHLASAHLGWSVHLPVAVGSEGGQVPFYVSANSVSSSALRVLNASVNAAPQSQQIETRTVSVVTVDELYRYYCLPTKGVMLKIDTQGYEWAVLDGARESLRIVDLVFVELSLHELYKGQRLWLDVIQRMAVSGFEMWALQPEFVDPITGRTLQVNALFSRVDWQWAAESTAV